MYVILCGNPVDGIQVHGPFPSSDEAHEWAECGLKGESWWVTELHSEQNAEHYMIYLHDEDGVVMDWLVHTKPSKRRSVMLPRNP